MWVEENMSWCKPSHRAPLHRHTTCGLVPWLPSTNGTKPQVVCLCRGARWLGLHQLIFSCTHIHIKELTYCILLYIWSNTHRVFFTFSQPHCFTNLSNLPCWWSDIPLRSMFLFVISASLSNTRTQNDDFQSCDMDERYAPRAAPASVVGRWNGWYNTDHRKTG